VLCGFARATELYFNVVIFFRLVVPVWRLRNIFGYSVATKYLVACRFGGADMPHEITKNKATHGNTNTC
jgi:hypothetical protein